MARSEMIGHSFLALIQIRHKLCFENFSCKLMSFKLHKLILGMARVWPTEISIVDHRHNQSVAMKTILSYISSIVCFVFWDMVTKTKYCCLLKVKIFGPSQIFGLATLLLGMVCGSNFPKSNFQALKLCMKLVMLF